MRFVNNNNDPRVDEIIRQCCSRNMSSSDIRDSLMENGFRRSGSWINKRAKQLNITREIYTRSGKLSKEAGAIQENETARARMDKFHATHGFFK